MKQIIFATTLIFVSCFATFAQTYESLPNIEGDPVDTFKKLAFPAYVARVHSLFVSVNNNPSSKGLIVLEINKKDKKKAKVEQLRNIYKAADLLKFDKSRLLVIVFEGDYQETTLWVIPQGAKSPEIKTENYTLIKGEDLKQKINELFPKN